RVLNILGPIFCLGAPEDMPGKALIYLSVVFQLIGLGISVAFQLKVVPLNDLNIVLMLGVAAVLLAIAAFVLFIVFLKRVGEYMGNGEVTSRAQSTINTLIAFSVC